MSTGAQKVYEFGEFRLSEGERCLWKRDRPVNLPPRTIDTLIALVRRHGHIVSREELLEAVWPDTFVEEHNINVCISTLRKALDIGSRTPLIETVPRRGYRFASVVSEVDERDAEVVVIEKKRLSQTTIESVEAVDAIATARGLLTVRRLGLIAALAVIGIGSFFWFGYGRRAATPAMNAAAYSDYLTGVQLMRKRDIVESAKLFEQAVRVEPEFALAWAQLAICYAMLDVPSPQAESAVKRALTLAPDLSEAHAALGYIEFFHHWNWDAADREFARSVEIDPQNASAHQWHATLIAARGDTKTAIAKMQHALDIDVTSSPINSSLCQLYYFDRQYDLANVQCIKVIGADKAFKPVYDHYFAVERKRGLGVEALWAMKAAHGHDDRVREAIERSQREGSLEHFDRFHEAEFKKNLTGDYPSWELARILAATGRNDEAIKWLDSAYERHNFNFVFVKVDPVFEALWDDPRFKAIVEKMKFN